MKIDTRFIISAICIIVSVAISYAQKMAIASFKMDDEDQTTNVKPTMEEDQNGEKYALIKIATTQKNFTIDVETIQTHFYPK